MAGYDLRLLMSFVVLADELHFGRAAERLHVAQPALSRQMQRLERQIGATLFIRSSRSVELTPAAQAFLPHAARALAAAERASAATRAAATTGAGELRLGLDLDIPQSVIRRVRAFGGDHPDVRLRVTVRQQDDALSDLERGELDAVVGWISGMNSDLTATPIASVPFVAALREDDARAADECLPRHALCSVPLVLFERAVAPECFDHLTTLLRETVPRALEVIEAPPLDSPQEGQLEAVRSTGGVTIVSEEYFLHAEPPGLVAVPLDPPLALEVVLFSSGDPDRPVARLQSFLANSGAATSSVSSPYVVRP